MPKSRVLGPFAAGVDATPTDHEGRLGLRSEVSSDGPIGARDVAAQDREAEEACVVHVVSNGVVGHLVLRAHLAGAYFVVPADGRVAAWIVPSEWRVGCASSAINNMLCDARQLAIQGVTQRTLVLPIRDVCLRERSRAGCIVR